jgi:hypothetical protein
VQDVKNTANLQVLKSIDKTTKEDWCMFPKIDSPCPLSSLQLPKSGNFNCSACKREVHDLTQMSDVERQDFLSACEGKVCVSYSVKSGINKLKKAAVAGVFVVTASGLALPLAAQEINEDFEDIVVTGGIDNPKTKILEKESTEDESEPLELIPVVEESDIDNEV